MVSLLCSYQAQPLRLLASQPDLKLHSGVISEKLGIDALRILDSLESEGFVTFSPYTGFFMIQPPGLAALAEYNASQEELRQQRADQDCKDKEQSAKDDKDKQKQLRHDLLVASVGAAVGSAVTGLIDHFAEFCSLIEQLIAKALALFH